MRSQSETTCRGTSVYLFLSFCERSHPHVPLSSEVTPRHPTATSRNGRSWRLWDSYRPVPLAAWLPTPCSMSRDSLRRPRSRRAVRTSKLRSRSSGRRVILALGTRARGALTGVPGVVDAHHPSPANTGRWQNLAHRNHDATFRGVAQVAAARGRPPMTPRRWAALAVFRRELGE